MIKMLVYNVPSTLKLRADSGALILVGEYGHTQLLEPSLTIFLKRGQLILCSALTCYSVAKLTNAIKGALHGHIKWLRLNGVGYKAAISSNELKLSLGLSHKLTIQISQDMGINIIKNNKLKLKSANLNKVTAAASALVARRQPDAYRAKGIVLRKSHTTKQHAKR
ncbi:50S ribosomal protein L6 [Candidatus Hodgkinia cicadicola]